MKFDFSKVYSWATADELKSGDLVICADTIPNLKDLVENDETPETIDKIKEADKTYRFALIRDEVIFDYAFAYLVGRAKRLRPYTTTEELIAHWLEKGGAWQDKALTLPNIWVKHRSTGIKSQISDFDIDFVYLGDMGRVSLGRLAGDYLFLDDSPCGILEEVEK